MSIRIISSGGQSIGYQAIGGAGKAGLSKYFSALMPGAHDAALEMVAALEQKAALQCKPKDPLRGLRITLRPSRDADRPPLRYVEAMWRVNGKARHRSYSADKHGRDIALALAMDAMAADGRAFGCSIPQIMAQLLADFNRRYDIT